MINTKSLEDIPRMKTQLKRYKLRHGIHAVYCEALQTINPDVQASIPVKLEHSPYSLGFLAPSRKK